MRARCWCSWHAGAVLVRPACVLVLRLQGQGTWGRAREQGRGSERARDCCCGCYGGEIPVADEMLLVRLALRGSGEVLATALATAMLATAIARVMLPIARWGWCDLRKREMHGGNDADARVGKPATATDAALCGCVSRAEGEAPRVPRAHVPVVIPPRAMAMATATLPRAIGDGDNDAADSTDPGESVGGRQPRPTTVSA